MKIKVKNNQDVTSGITAQHSTDTTKMGDI